MSVEENLIAWKVSDKPYAKGIVRNKKAVREYAKHLIQEYDIRPGDPTVLTQSLSGGNAQKIVVAREVDADGKLLIAAQPSRGVDIGAIESIRTILQDVKKKGLEKKKGKGILLVSADLEEIMALSDRVVVMYEGKIMGTVYSDEINAIGDVGMLMLGQTRENNQKEVS